MLSEVLLPLVPIVMMVFGGIMLWFAYETRKKTQQNEKEAELAAELKEKGLIAGPIPLVDQIADLRGRVDNLSERMTKASAYFSDEMGNVTEKIGGLQLTMAQQDADVRHTLRNEFNTLIGRLDTAKNHHSTQLAVLEQRMRAMEDRVG